MDAKAREWNFHVGRFIGGVIFLPYQLAAGFTLRFWPGAFAPSIRIYLGPLKAWAFWEVN